MPLETIASACARIVASSTLLWKWFQLFQPIGGVAAMSMVCAGKKDARRMHSATKRRELILLKDFINFRFYEYEWHSSHPPLRIYLLWFRMQDCSRCATLHPQYQNIVRLPELLRCRG